MSVSDFETFWKAYPRKVGKDAAEKAWSKKKPILADVIDALKWQILSEQWAADGGKFIPHPATYLNQGRWQDEPQENKSNIEVRNKGHVMSDESFNLWLNGGVNGRLT
jgi:hypothetical protein